MIVFKNYFKIVKMFLPVILMYVGIFTFFSVIATTNNNVESTFSTVKPNIAIINNDKSSVLSETFIDYVSKHSNIIEVGWEEEKLRDAIFYREVDYILIIPEGFSELFMIDDNIKIETMKVPDSFSATIAEMLFNKFWNIVSVYKKSGMNEVEISNLILENLEERVEVSFLESNQNTLQNVVYFYNFTNYTILATCIFVVGMVISIYNDTNIKKRNTISSVSYKSINIQLFLGNLCMTLLLWILYILISFCLYGKVMFSNAGLLIILNSLVFSITALSIGFLVGNLVKNKEAQNGIVNVLALGSSFICGAFVPQEMLGSFVLKVARILPSYWFIKNNNDIINISKFNISSMQPIFINMIIVLGFGLLFFIITNIVSKAKLKSN